MTSSPAGRTGWRLERIESAVALLAAGAALVTLLTATTYAGALWRDEVNSLNTASTPSWSEMWRLSEFDSFPLLWLALLRIWIATGAGASDAGLRVLGFLGGLALFSAVGFAALRLGRRVPLVSLALLAVNPEVIRWGASLRAWGLGAALAIVAFVFVREATVAPTRRGIVLAVVFAVLSVQCVFQNAVLLAASVAGCMAAAVVRREWRLGVVPLGVGIAAAASLLPYAPNMRRALDWRVLLEEPLTLGFLVERAGVVFAASGTIVFLCWVAVIGLALASLARARDRSRIGTAVASIVTSVVAAGGLALFLLRLGHPTQPWYYIGLVVLVAACMEEAIESQRSRAIRLATVLLAVVVLAAGLPGARRALTERLTNVDQVAGQLGIEATRGDLIVVNPWYLAISFERYYHGGADVTTLPPLEDRRLHRYDLLKQKMLSADPIGPLLSRIQRVLGSGRRVWIVGRMNVPAGKAPPSPDPPPLLRTHWSSVPYENAWELQTGASIRDHARVFTSIEAPARWEAAGLLVVRGWRP